MLNANNPVGRALSAVLEQLILSVLFLLCSLPVVTLCASAIALYETEMSILTHGSGVVTAEFFGAFRRNFLRGLGAFAALLGLFVVMGGVASALILLGLPLWPVALVFAGVYVAAAQWLLLLLARFDAPLRTCVGNAFMLCLTNPLLSLLILALTVGYPALFLVMPESVWSGYFFLLLFFVSGLCALGNSALFLRRIEKKYADAIENNDK